MERVLFVTGSNDGVGKSTGAIVHLDNFEMRSQEVCEFAIPAWPKSC